MADYQSVLARSRAKILDTRSSSGSSGEKDMPDVFTRDMGGEFRKNQPFISGFHQILMTVPEKLFAESGPEAQKWLSSTCESFTPHTVTPNFADVMGIGQTGATFLTSKTIGREFTLAFREYQKMPIASIIDGWHGLFDDHAGVSSLQGADFIPISYKASCMVFQMKPTGARPEDLTADDVEELYVYHGVFPKTNPRDTVGASDQTANDVVQASVTFSFDGAPFTSRDTDVLDYAVRKLSSLGHYLLTPQQYSDAALKIGSEKYSTLET